MRILFLFLFEKLKILKEENSNTIFIRNQHENEISFQIRRG